jgi:hypothetical protein
MYGFMNPVLSTENVGLNITAPQQLGRYFKSGSKFTAAGDRVERMFAAMNRKGGRPMGVHIGQVQDYSRIPRYEVQGANARYDIAGIPDFLKFKRGQGAGQYEVDVYDVKNLSSLKGMKPNAAIKDIMDNPAYGTQVPGYQTMLADIEWLRGGSEGADNMREMLREQLASDPEQLEIFNEMLKEGKDITARGAYVASRYTPEEAMRAGGDRKGMLGAIGTGLENVINKGKTFYQGKGKSAPNIVRAQMPTITTADVPAQQKIIAGKAEQAQGMARSLALQATLYQSHAIKRHIMGDEGLRLEYGDQEFTPAEEDAAAFWQTKGREGETKYYGRNPLEINPNISRADLYSLRHATDINLSMLSGGDIPVTAGGIGDGGRKPPISVLEEMADPEEPGRKRTTTKKAVEQLAATGGVSPEVLKILSNLGGGKDSTRIMYGRKTPMTGAQLSRYYGGFEKLFKEQIGTMTTAEGFAPGRLVEQYQKIPEMLAGQFSGTQATQIRGLDPQMAMITAQSFAQEQGMSFSGLLKKSGVGGLLGTWNALEGMAKTIMPNMGKISSDATGGRGGFVPRAMMALFGGSESEAQGFDNEQGMMPFMRGAPGAFETARKFKSAFTTGGTPAGEFGSIAQAWVEQFGKMTEQIDRSTNSLVQGEKGFKDLDEMLKKTTITADNTQKVMGRYEALEEKRMMRWEKAANVREAYGGTAYPQPGQGARTLTADERAYISRAGGTTEQARAVKAFMQSDVDVAQGRRALAYTLADREVPGERGGFKPQGFARMGRAMLGGFGLMYLRNIYDIATGGAQTGYQPYTQLQTQMSPQLAGMYPGQQPYWTAEQEVQQAQLPYAGSGFAGLQNFVASQYRDPTRAGLASLGGAALAAGGAGLWMGSMVGAPWLGAVGAVAAPLLVNQMQRRGALTDMQGTATGLAGRYYSGQWGMEDFHEMMQQQNTLAGSAMDYANFGLDNQANQLGYNFSRNIIEPFGRWMVGITDPQKAAAMEDPEIAAMAFEVLNIQQRRDELGGDVDLETLLEGMGYSPTEIGERTRWVGTAQQAGLDIPPEGVIGAELLASRYGMQLGRQPGGAFETLAGAVSMQMPWIQGAAQISQADPWSTFEQQEQETGDLLQLWSDRGGITDAELARMRGGAQRFAGLGTAAPDFGGAGRRKREFMGQLGDMSAAQYGVFAREYQMGGMMKQMGLFWQPPSAEEYAGMDSGQIRQRERELGVQQMRTSAMFGVYQGMNQLGFAQPSMVDYQDMTTAQLGNVGAQVRGAFGVQQQMELAGAPNAEIFGQAVGLMEGKIGQRMLGVLGGDRMQWARYALERPQEFAQLPFEMPGVGGSTIDKFYMGATDIREGYGGAQTMTGMQWGTSSLAMPGISSAGMAGRIWGGDYQSRTDISQGLAGALVSGGRFGGRLYQMEQQAAHTQAMAGIQMEQIALNRTFQTGVGLGQYTGIVNPQTGQPFGFNTGAFNVNVRGVGGFQTQGGGLWGVQDAMRGLGNMQQEWQFGRQWEQSAMQDRFWQQNFNLNRRQAMMQRPWRREDWAYQDTTRGLQWQWRQEDFQEESRFMTGRDRRLAERQMGRDTIMYGLEGEQIDKQRERQEDLWKLEDERFMLQEAQHREQVEFQEEGIRVQERFFEERKRLTEEQYKLQRAFQIRQMELSEKQAAAAAAYAAEQAKMALTMEELSQFTTEVMAQGSLFNEQTLTALADALEDINPELAKLIRQLIEAQKDLGKGGGGSQEPWESDDGDAFQEPWEEPEEGEQGPRQYGGYVEAGREYTVGEAGPEKFKPFLTGQIVPNHRINPAENTVIAPTSDAKVNQLIHLILNLGDQHFREYILDTVDAEIDV